MVRLQYFSTLILLILVFGCNSNTNVIDEFPNEQYLKGELEADISILTNKNVNLVIIDSLLVVQKHDEPLFQVFTLNGYKLLSEFGRKGKGPNEFIFPTLINQTAYSKSDSLPLIYVYDLSRREFTEINLINTIKQQDSSYRVRSVPYYDQYFTYFTYDDNNYLIATPENNYRHVIYDYKKEDYIEIPYIPSLGFTMDKSLLSSIYRTATTVNERKRIFASSPLLIGEFDLFNFNGELISSSHFDSKKNNYFKNLNKNLDGFDPKYFIIQLQSNEKYIYALNMNNLQSDVIANKAINNQTILVYDWNGNPIRKYILDNKYFIKSFAIDWSKGDIIGYCADRDRNNIIIYKTNTK